MGARTDAARTEVVAARQALATESARMGTATREAVDIPAKIRRAPAKSAAVAGGAAFVVLGGPRRVARRLRRAVRGEPAPMPSSMLPKEIDKAIRSLGSDGDAVRGALERSFAGYLAKNGKLTDRSVRGATEEAIATAIRTAGRGVGAAARQAGPGRRIVGGRQRLRPDAPDHPARHDTGAIPSKAYRPPRRTIIWRGLADQVHDHGEDHESQSWAAQPIEQVRG